MRIAGRPFGLYVLAVLGLAGAAWALTGVAGLRPLADLAIKGLAVPAEVVRAATAVWAAMSLASAVLLFVRPRWGWTLAMLTTGMGLLVMLWTWYLGSEDPVRLAIVVGTAFYLNGREIRDLVDPPAERGSAVPLAPPGGGRR